MPTDWSENIMVAELLDEPALSEELGSLIQRAEGGGEAMPHVVLNFAGVSYVNSSNLGQMLKLRTAVGSRGRQLRVCSVGPDVWSVLQVTGLDKLFSFAPDPLTALASLQLADAGS